MIVRLFVFAVLACFAAFPNGVSQACTTTLTTKGATTDGSVIVSHSDDDELSDQRVIYVPAMDHAPGAKRPVYLSDSFDFPRLVSPDRGPGYDTPDYPETQILGYIPQVRHTYAYFDGNYGIMNERQLMIGECTDGALHQPDAEPGKRIFYSAELSRIALERCSTAREAVELIGSLIDEYGLYSTGETLLLGDTSEGWVLEMAPTPDPLARGVWVAKKVPDGEVFVGANEFRIREVDPADPDMLFSPNLFDACTRLGWWNSSQGPLDWLKAVSLGEYNHPYYSLRRVWRIFDRLNPGLGLSPWVENGYTKAYPFSVKPTRKLTPADVMALHRDHYEGTDFDMTKGLAAGPFGSPTRWLGPYEGSGDVSDPNQPLEGAWERPISMYYMGYSYVLQARAWLPDAIGGTAWIGLDDAYTSCYIPFYAGVNDLPASFQTGNPQKFSRETAWWAFNFLANWAELRFDAISADIIAKQVELETAQINNQAVVIAEATRLYNQSPSMARDYLTDYCAGQRGRYPGPVVGSG